MSDEISLDGPYIPEVFIRPLYFTPTKIESTDWKQRLYVSATSIGGGYPSEDSTAMRSPTTHEIRNSLKLLTVVYGNAEPYLKRILGDDPHDDVNWKATCSGLRSKLSNAGSSNARLLLVREVITLHDFDVWRHNLGRQIAILSLQPDQASEAQRLQTMMDGEVEKLQTRIAALIVAIETCAGNVVPRRIFLDKPLPRPIRTLLDIPRSWEEAELSRLKGLQEYYRQPPAFMGDVTSDADVPPARQPYSLMTREARLSTTIWTKDLFLLVAHEWLSPFRDAFDVEANLRVPKIVSMLFYRFRYTCEAQYSFIVAPTLTFNDIRVSSENVFIRSGETSLMPLLRKQYKNHMSQFRQRFEEIWLEGNSLADFLVLPGSRAKGPRAQEQLPAQPAVRATAVDEETRVDFVL